MGGSKERKKQWRINRTKETMEDQWNERNNGGSMERKKQWRINGTKETIGIKNNGQNFLKSRDRSTKKSSQELFLSRVRIKGTKETMDQGDERNNGTKEQ